MADTVIGNSDPDVAIQASRGSISAFIASLAVSIALGVSYFPITPSSVKFSILIGLTALISVLSIPTIVKEFSGARIKWLSVLTISFIAMCFVHGLYYPPVTEYAASKFANLAFSLIVFQIIIVMPFLRDGRGIFLVYSLFVFGLVYAIINLTPAGATSNLRYSAIGLSPTMMAKIVLVVAVFALTMPKNTALGKMVMFALLIFSVWSSVRTGSRGPVLMLAISYGALLYLKGGVTAFAKWMIFAPIIFAIVVVSLGFLPEQIASRFEWSKLSIESQSDSGDRVFLWELALAGLRYSWIGYGLGNYSAATFLAAPHNIILESAYELGLFITLIYSIIIMSPLLWVGRLAKKDSPVLDFFILLYLMMLSLSLISGEMTLTSALMYVSGGFIWGVMGDGDSRRHRSLR